MTLYRFHHVGIVTTDLNATVAFYEGLGYTASEKFEDAYQLSNIVLMKSPDSPLIELVEPQSDASPATGWTKRVKTNSYHTCYEVKNLAEAVTELKTKNILPVTKPYPSAAFELRPVVFLWGTACGLVELVQSTVEPE